jgi:hypothetical protein
MKKHETGEASVSEENSASMAADDAQGQTFCRESPMPFDGPSACGAS